MINDFKTATPGGWFLVYLEDKKNAYEFFKYQAVKNNYLDLFLEEDTEEMFKFELQYVTKPSWYGYHCGDLIYPLDKLIQFQLEFVLSLRIGLTDATEEFAYLVKLYNFYKNENLDRFHGGKDLDPRSSSFINDLKIICKILGHTLI